MAGITGDLGGSPDNFRQDNIAGPHGTNLTTDQKWLFNLFVSLTKVMQQADKKFYNQLNIPNKKDSVDF